MLLVVLYCGLDVCWFGWVGFVFFVYLLIVFGLFGSGRWGDRLVC